jgi:hypothetical protein
MRLFAMPDISSVPPLATLNRSQIGRHGAIALVQMLEMRASLRSIDLSHNPLGVASPASVSWTGRHHESCLAMSSDMCHTIHNLLGVASCPSSIAC